MAISDIENYGLLNRWAIRMTENIYHFNQLAGANAPLTNAGDYVYVQHERQALADSISEVMPLFVSYAGFYPRPEFVHERVLFRRGHDLTLKYGYVKGFGRRAVTLISAAVTVTYSGDSASFTVATTLTDLDELQVFFKVADGADSAASALYRIEPLRVVADGVNATFTGHRALFSKPSNWLVEYGSPNYNASSKMVYDSAAAGSYVTEVDVYRVYPDSATGIDLLYDSGCCGGTPGTFTGVAGAALLQDATLGTFSLSELAGCGFQHRYTYADVYYKAGYPLEANGDYYSPYRDAVLMLANCALGRTLSPFDQQRLNVLQYDQMVETVNDVPLYPESPFGIQRGQIKAWNIVNRTALGQGGSL